MTTGSAPWGLNPQTGNRLHSQGINSRSEAHGGRLWSTGQVPGTACHAWYRP